MSLYPVNDAHRATSFSSIVRRSIGDHRIHRGTLFPTISRQSINGSHQDAQQVPHALFAQLIDHGGRIFSDEDMMAVQHRSFFEEQSRERKSGWSKEAILKSLKTRNTRVSQESGICTICMDGFRVDEKIGSLSCGHEFHVSCIKDWLIVDNTCPVCRRSALEK
ncbi:hypothetical protein Sjap_023765 [Stephania japonica]|uniref:RING-type E3 ubiquitin transferase n=1 Tax=Stephania japonica TaxID=461633 RepID=A0AAP0EHH1_9MAGN